MTDLKALSDAATQGEWRAEIDEDGLHPAWINVRCGYDEDQTLLWNEISSRKELKVFDARLAAALVNTYRAGDLHTTADLQAAVEVERERCAQLVESYADIDEATIKQLTTMQMLDIAHVVTASKNARRYAAKIRKGGNI